MRSITYILTKKPKNRSDCFDYNEAVSNVRSVQVMLSRTMSDSTDILIEVLSGKFSWIFNDETTAIYDETFGGIIFQENDIRRSKSLLNANRRLEIRIKDMESRLQIKLLRKNEKF